MRTNITYDSDCCSWKYYDKLPKFCTISDEIGIYIGKIVNKYSTIFFYHLI